MSEIREANVEFYIEIRGIYDGWSVAKMKDGSYVNRWPENDRRYQPTQDWIASMQKARK